MDLAGDFIDEKYYYGWDFSNKQKIYQIFFTGADNYFPAIANCSDAAKMDQYPVYVFDLASGGELTYVGNFKHYMTKILKEFIKKSDHAEHYSEAKQALKDLNVFSDKIINKKYH